MRKYLVVAAAALIASAGAAFAVIGTPPTNGFGLPDGNWLNGLASGHNLTTQSGLVAHAGGTKAAALQITPQIALIQFDTVATNGDSALLPPCIASGIHVFVANAGAATLSLYGRGTDTINAAATATNYDLTTNTNADFYCIKVGAWKAVKGS